MQQNSRRTSGESALLMTTLSRILVQENPVEFFSILHRDGAVIVNDFQTHERLDQLEAELSSALEAQPLGGRGDDPIWRLVHGANTRRLGSLTSRSESFLHILLDPRLSGFASRVLGRLGGSPVLNTAQLIAIGPGERAQPLHRDAASWIHLLGPGPNVMVGCMIACTDFSEENGATRIAVGSQDWPDLNTIPQAPLLDVASMPRGSALFYTGKLLHGGGANRASDEWRVGLHISFVLAWLRPEEQHQLAMSIEQARRLPSAAQRLLGFSTYYPGLHTGGGRLGLVDGDDIQPLMQRPQ